MAPKRSAASSCGVAKRARDDGRAARIRLVVQALRDSSLPAVVPASARLMLAKAARRALAEPAGERHRMQDAVVGCIHELFGSVSEGLRAQITERQQAADRMASDLKGLLEKLEASSAALEDAEGAMAARRERLTECDERFGAVDAEARAVEARQSGNARQHDALSATRAKYKAMAEGSLKMLAEGTSPSPKAAQKAADRLIRDMTKLGAEASLLAAAPDVLLTRPEERKGFDSMVLDALKDVLSQRTASVDAEIAANEAIATELGKEVAEKDDVVQVATSQRDAAANELEEAEAIHGEKASAKSAMEEAIDACRLDQASCARGIAAARDEAASFAEVRAALDFLAKFSGAQLLEEAAAAAGA